MYRTLAIIVRDRNKTDGHLQGQQPRTAGRLSRRSEATWTEQLGKNEAPQHYEKLLAYCRTHNDLADYAPYFAKWTAEEMANTAISLCHMVDKAMTTFMEKRDREFVEEGGVRERMTAARLDMRGTQKQIIAQQEQEIAALKARIAALEREIAALKGEG